MAKIYQPRIISAKSLTFDEFYSRMNKPIQARATGDLIEKKRRTFTLNDVTFFSFREIAYGVNGKRLVRKVTNVNNRTRETKVWLGNQRMKSYS